MGPFPPIFFIRFESVPLIVVGFQRRGLHKQPKKKSVAPKSVNLGGGGYVSKAKPPDTICTFGDFEKLYVGLAETMRHPYIFPPVFPLFLFEMNDQLHISKSVFQKMAIWVY